MLVRSLCVKGGRGRNSWKEERKKEAFLFLFLKMKDNWRLFERQGRSSEEGTMTPS